MRISVVVVAYDAGPALVRCLRSLEGDNVEVVLVNNGAPGPEIADAAALAFVKLVSPESNLGFAAGCNVGARETTGDVVVFLNPDTVVARGALAELAATLDDPSIGIAMPRLRLLDEPDLLNSAGNVVHVTGLAWAGGYRKPASEVTEIRDIPYASGAAFAIRADLFGELGGFTDELFIYQEDLELSWKARMRGLRVVLNPRADVYHEYEYGRHVRKLYFLERNRLIFLLSAFSPRLLLLLTPVLVSAEVALSLLALRDRWLKDKVAGWAWCVRNARWIARHRREIQRLRKVPDADLADFLTPTLDPGMIALPGRAGALNPLVAAYWSLVRKLL